MKRETGFALLGAVLGCAIVVAAEALLLVILNSGSGYRITPRGLGWIAMPVLGLFAGWRFGKSGAFQNVAQAVFDNQDGSSERRMWIAGITIWVMCVFAFHLIFNPYGSYWSDDEWTQFWSVLIAPPLLLKIAAMLLSWAKGPSNP